MHALTGGEPTMLRRLLDELLTSNRKDLETLEGLVQRQETGELAELAHRIKGAARVVRGEQLVESCRRLEDACLSPNASFAWVEASTNKVLRLCSSAATIAPAAPSRPKAAAATIARVQPRPIATLTCRVRRHCRLSRTQVPRRRRSLPISTISAEARAMSAPPAPIVVPWWAGRGSPATGPRPARNGRSRCTARR